MYVMFAPAANDTAVSAPAPRLSPDAGNTSQAFAPLLTIVTLFPAAADGSVTESPVVAHVAIWLYVDVKGVPLQL